VDFSGVLAGSGLSVDVSSVVSGAASDVVSGAAELVATEALPAKPSNGPSASSRRTRFWRCSVDSIVDCRTVTVTTLQGDEGKTGDGSVDTANNTVFGERPEAKGKK